MPRFFPSFGRSREHARTEYPVYDDYEPYEQPQRSHTPAWRKVIPNLKGGDHRAPRTQTWGEEFVEYPESYGGSEYHRGYSSRRYPAYDFDVQSESTISPPDDHYLDRYDNNIPIVQRESSLSRLAEAFTSHGASPRPVTEVSLPQGTPRYSPRDVSSAPYAPEIRNTYPEQHQPVMVPNMTAHSVQADIIGSHSRRGHHHRGRQEERGTRARDDYRRDSSSDRSSEYMDDDYDYGTYYIAIKHGRRGEKDKYWIVPSGTSVVFQDSDGNELTRVGDNNGRYRPLEQPMILEDSRGREIGRLGFDDETSLDYDYRRYGSSVGSDDDLYERDRDYDYRHPTQDRRYNDKGTPRPDRVPRSEGSVTSTSDYAEVYYIAPSEAGSVTGRGSSHHSGRSSRSRQGTVPKTAIIDLDELARRRKKSGSVSSGTSSGRSYDSGRRY